MPQSLIHTGYVDQVLRVEEMPAVLLRYTQHPGLELHPQGVTARSRGSSAIASN